MISVFYTWTLLLAISTLYYSGAFHILETLPKRYRQPLTTSTITTSSVMLSMASSAGPKAAGRRRPSRKRNNAGDDSTSSSTGSSQPQRQQRKRKQPPVFDGKSMTADQIPNEEAAPLDLELSLLKKDDDGDEGTTSSSSIRCMTSEKLNFEMNVDQQPPFTFMSLDDLFDNNNKEIKFSDKFNSDSQFRIDLRTAIRKDIFDTTPFYANLPEKAMTCLLLPDSSLEGSWRKPDFMNERMNQTTAVLRDALGPEAPTGDELFYKIGKLCGNKPTTHWIDIFGIQDRKISHSWHLDSGSPENCKTVLWGFPPEDNYEGCGVFSHLVPLSRECVAPDDHPRLEPILFDGTVDEKHIVRPKYSPGRELIMYRDVDVIHSAPDVTYRTSVMRFM